MPPTAWRASARLRRPAPYRAKRARSGAADSNQTPSYASRAHRRLPEAPARGRQEAEQRRSPAESLPSAPAGGHERARAMTDNIDRLRDAVLLVAALRRAEPESARHEFVQRLRRSYREWGSLTR